MTRVQLEMLIRRLCAQIDVVIPYVDATLQPPTARYSRLEGQQLMLEVSAVRARTSQHQLSNLHTSTHELLQRIDEDPLSDYDFAEDDLAFDAWRESR